MGRKSAKSKPRQYEVEMILERRPVVEMLVKWRGYDDPRENTWLTRSQLLEECPAVVAKYEKEHGVLDLGEERKEGTPESTASAENEAEEKGKKERASSSESKGVGPKEKVSGFA